MIIRGFKLLPPSIIRNMNQFNNIHDGEPNDPPGECKIQPTAAHFKSRTSPPKTSPVVSYIMDILNYHAIYNVDVEVHP